MAERLTERDGAARRWTFQCTNDAYVLPAALHTSVQTVSEVHACNVAVATNGQPEEVVYTGGADDLEVDEAVQAEYV
jgi:hypothetical protein